MDTRRHPRAYRAVITANHRSRYPRPIRIRPTDQLSVGRRDSEFPGWVWVTKVDGSSGWAPERYLTIEGTRATAMNDYDATEVDVDAGDRVIVLDTLSGWAWIRTTDDRHGWVPLSCLQRDDRAEGPGASGPSTAASAAPGNVPPHACTIRPMVTGEAAACELVMRSLPKWFGIESSIVQYRKDIERMETIVAEHQGKIVGFLTLNRHTEHSAEIHVMGISEGHHRRGLGRDMVEEAERLLRPRGIEYLQVKTLGPSRENAEYARTRLFYQAVGFRALEETKLWGEGSPCLIMVKHLGHGRTS